LNRLIENYEIFRPKLQGLVLALEGLVLLLTIFAFWHHAGGSTGVREHWLWLLWFVLPFSLMRLFVFKRAWTNTPLLLLLLLFVALSQYNFYAAPLHRENYLIIMGRPLLGIWTVVYMTEVGRFKNGLMVLLVATVSMGFVLGMVALTTTDWVTDKSAFLLQISRSLPSFDYREAAASWAGVQGCGGLIPLVIGQNCFNVSDILVNLMWGFNPNEIAGALAWVCPAVAAFAVGLPNFERIPRWQNWLIRGIFAFVFALLFVALILGQSRFAVAGVLGSLIVVAFLLLRGKWRWLALGFVALNILFQAALLFNLFPSGTSTSTTTASTGITGRDESSFTTRFEIWDSAIQMMLDYPTTGVGMGMFRTAISQDRYLVPFFENNGLPNPPHAHNEWLQMGADLGIGGFLLYLALQIAVIFMIWKGWRHGDSMARLIAVAALAGLLAHSVYGMGDAVTIWDRFQFILWWLVGLASAQYAWAMKKDAFKQKTFVDEKAISGQHSAVS
jgi:O-antigen ligase